MLAFALEDYLTGKKLDDPTYVKWVAILRIEDKAKWQSLEMPVYPCQDSDYKKLYPVDERSSNKLSQFKTDPEK